MEENEKGVKLLLFSDTTKILKKSWYGRQKISTYTSN